MQNSLTVALGWVETLKQRIGFSDAVKLGSAKSSTLKEYGAGGGGMGMDMDMAMEGCY